MGFDHLDLVGGDDASSRALPVGIRMVAKPGTGYARPTPRARADWDLETERLRRRDNPGVEPWAGSLFGSDGAIDRVVEEVPGIQLVVDTGHVTQWGGDLLGLLPFADHVQLRQTGAWRRAATCRPARGRLRIGRLDWLDYQRLLSVEHFDLPQFSWPLDDPVDYTTGWRNWCGPMLETSAVSRSGRNHDLRAVDVEHHPAEGAAEPTGTTPRPSRTRTRGTASTRPRPLSSSST